MRTKLFRADESWDAWIAEEVARYKEAGKHLEVCSIQNFTGIKPPSLAVVIEIGYEILDEPPVYDLSRGTEPAAQDPPPPLPPCIIDNGNGKVKCYEAPKA